MVEVLPSAQDGSTLDLDSARTGPYRMYRRRWFGVFAMVRLSALEVRCVVFNLCALWSWIPWDWLAIGGLFSSSWRLSRV